MVDQGQAASVINVAREILIIANRPMSTMKLQKLCFYAQGWTLAWSEGVPLFNEDFEAWRNGPVCRELFAQHRGRYAISADDLSERGAPVDDWRRELIEITTEPYLPLTGVQLSDLTHEPDTPWSLARPGLNEDAVSRELITKDSMQKFFAKLMRKPTEQPMVL